MSEQKNKEKEVRKKYVDAIKALLLGPGSERINSNFTEEIISEKPNSRYTTGILFPAENLIEKDELEKVSQDMQEGFDKESSMEIDNSFLPSSMGLTFYCTASKTKLSMNLNTASYEPVKNPFVETTNEVLEETSLLIETMKNKKIKQLFEIDNEHTRIRYAYNEKDRDDIVNLLLREIPNHSDWSYDVIFLINKIKNINYGKKNCYKRIAYTQDVEIDLKEGIKRQELILNEKCAVQIFSKIKKLYVGREIVNAVTIVVKNISSNHLFQTELCISKQADIKFVATEDIKIPDMNKLNSEDAMNTFLYRNKKTYAHGQGVSAVWDFLGNDIDVIKTSYLPSYELVPISFEIPNLDPSVLQASSYINMDKDIQLHKLNIFVEAYEKWINKLEEKVSELIPEFQTYAIENIEKCKESCRRMKKTTVFLEQDNIAFTAFNLANEAMLLQRIDDMEEKVSCYEASNYQSMQFAWRPFQLAFVLHSLESILNEKSDEREILDLIWVSTGGGKTEAYLFAIAAVIVYRKMKYKNSDGVSVIMRYTLRLLTAQQFERASQLICALEFIRRRRPELGNKEITIGLWIGEGTQNILKNAKSNFREMSKASSLEEAKKKNTFQVLRCPWCKEDHSIIPRKEKFDIPRKWGYSVIDKRNPKYNMKCTNSSCEFSKGLPIYVVDESIYEVRPSLLFGTVDKFAQIPLKEETQKLFGSDDLSNYRRPELIIQDELHLISGPLGSIVGIYEAGFDYIFKNGKNVIPPKYIASTATIRNAKEQVQSIFNRKVFQFPPNGIEVSDNFFVKEEMSEPGRSYLGVMATGKSQVTAEIRLISSMLQMITEIGITPEEEELFWTVTGYFNSIRELGKASGLIRDDVKEYINQLSRRNNTKKRIIYDNTSLELTSRIPGIEIPEILNKLEVKHSLNGDKEKNKAIDTLIATNMISVGVDISRLNTMFVVGQPKLTSEYIQATSRVGRNSLGLVCTLYNSSRSRDRSHYETFQSYHQSLYKYVEASSVTPFSIPALKKAAAAVIVSMLRNTVEDLSGDNSPINILDHENDIEDTISYLMERVRASEDKYKLYSKDAKIIIEEFINKWIELAEDVVGLDGVESKTKYYLHKTKSREFQGKLLLQSFDDMPYRLEATKVMGTMRNVEDSSYIRLID